MVAMMIAVHTLPWCHAASARWPAIRGTTFVAAELCGPGAHCARVAGMSTLEVDGDPGAPVRATCRRGSQSGGDRNQRFGRFICLGCAGMARPLEEGPSPPSLAFR